MKTIIISLVALLLIAANLTAQSPQAIARIDSARLLMAKCAKENKLAEVANLYQDSATIDGFDISISGQKAIKKYWSGIRGNGVDWQWEIDGYAGNDSLVTQTGRSYLTLRYGQRVITYVTSFTVVWQKQSRNDYKIKSDTYKSEGQFEVTPKKFDRDTVYITTPTDTIFGILLRPRMETNHKMPAMLCLQGGGDVGLDNYLLEAEFFAERGMVTLVCDKAGTGKSRGKSSWLTQTFEQKIDEYNVLLDWLREKPYVNKNKTGISGLSEGGRLSLALALKYPAKVAFVNSVSGPLQSFKENQLYAIRKLLQARKYDESVINTTLEIFNDYYNAISVGSIPTPLIDKILSIKKKFPDLYLPPASPELPRSPQRADVNFVLGKSKSLNTLKCPVLFQYGENDVVVNAEASLAMIPKQKWLEIKVYKNTDHSLIMNSGDIHPRYLLDKMEWLQKILTE